jgi:SNF2 family DNA or RNA helicase
VATVPSTEIKRPKERKVFTPKPFQVEDLELLKQWDSSKNWSEMGCMKTTTGLWWALEQQPNRILIITTRTGKTTYFETLPHIIPDDYELLNVTATVAPDFQKLPVRCVVLAHYNCFQNRARFVKRLLDISWDCVILDEAHRIKNRKAQWTKNIKRLKAGSRHIMTGTGFVNKPDEVFSLLEFYHPREFTSYWKFRKHFCKEEKLQHIDVSIVVGIREDNAEEFKRVVNERSVRRLKREVLRDLPDYYETPIYVDLNPVQKRMYREIKRELETLDAQGELLTSVNVLSQLSRLRQICVATPEVTATYYDEKAERTRQDIRLVEPSAKLDALSELVESVVGSETKLIVFSNFTDPLALAEKRFEKAGIQYIRLRVTDQDHERAHKVSTFQDPKGAQIFLSTIPLGGEAITLTAASTVVFLDRSWSPAANDQAISRAHRPGQKNAVQVIRIEARNTVDQLVNLRLEKKRDWFRQIFST